MTQKQTFVVLGIGVAIAAVALSVLVPGVQHKVPSKSISIYGAMDTSRSCRRVLALAAQEVLQIAETLNPDRDDFAAYRFDSTCEEIQDGRVPDNLSQLQDTLTRRLAPMPVRDGTDPALVWTEIATRISSDSSDSIAIAAFTDGDMDAPSHESLAAMAGAIRKIAKDRRVVYVGVYGITPENRHSLREMFAPLGDRLHFYDAGAVDMDPLIMAVKQGPPQGGGTS